jgi:hypothetical protein
MSERTKTRSRSQGHPTEKDPAVERGERLDTGKTIARAGKTTGVVPGATENSGDDPGPHRIPVRNPDAPSPEPGMPPQPEPMPDPGDPPQPHPGDPVPRRPGT